MGARWVTSRSRRSPAIQRRATVRSACPAPGAALVFLNDGALSNSGEGDAPKTFATTAVTKLHNTATVDQAVLATSNGHGGGSRELGARPVEVAFQPAVVGLKAPTIIGVVFAVAATSCFLLTLCAT